MARILKLSLKVQAANEVKSGAEEVTRGEGTATVWSATLS
jgi:hypothetical protein